MTKIIKTINKAAELLNKGDVGVIPTDTVYGIAARAMDINATTRLYDIKHREHKPGTVIAANIQQLIDLGVSEQILDSVSHFWPGAVSIVIDVDKNLDYLSQDVGSVAFRVVADTKTKQLLELTGPLVTSSANQPGQPTSKNISEAISYFDNTVDFYFDVGTIASHNPSTIIKIDNDQITILRDGAVKI